MAIGGDRVIALPNTAYSVTQMIEALERVAAGKGIEPGPVTLKPDPAIEAIVTSWPLVMDTTRARALGLPPDASLDQIIRDYIEDFGTGQ